MATLRLIFALTIAGWAAAQSPPQPAADQPKQEAESTKGEASPPAPASPKTLDAVKSLEERVALLEQELLEVRLQAQQAKASAAAAAAGPEPAGGPRRPQIEEEEPFDPAKLKASDDAEVEAVAKAVAVLLPANVRQLGSGDAKPGSAGAAQIQAGARTPTSQVTVQAGGPRPTRRVEPVIPASMRSSIPGELYVSVKVYVGANGEVMGTVPVRQGEPTADQIGVLVAEAVSRWRFEPVLQNGQPVATQTMVRFRYAR